MADHTPDHITAAARYAKLEAIRQPYLDRARDASKLTIPTMYPEDGHTGTSRLPTPFQSVGARGTNNLASKLMLALFPPASAFFKLSINEVILQRLEAESTEEDFDIRGEFDKALSKVERIVIQELDRGNARSSLSQALKLLIVGGNALVQFLSDGRLKIHPLTSYVVARDTEGTLVEIVVREGLSKESAPPEILSLLDEEQKDVDKDENKADPLWLYTRSILDAPAKRWDVFQEINDKEVPGSRGRVKLQESSFVALRWNVVDSEMYGRGLVEDYLGDLTSLEGLSQSIVEAAAAASKIVMLVDEAGTTDMVQLQNVPSGGIIAGTTRDIDILQLDKQQDFSVAAAVAERIERRLEAAFLLASSIQRDAERVSATEIRILAGELEMALGSVYATIANDLQKPLVLHFMASLQRRNLLPTLPDEAIHPTIITGLEALGRLGDLARLDSLISGVAQIFGPEAVSRYVNPGAYILRRAAAVGIDIEGVVRTDDEVEAAAAAAAQQQQQAALQQASVGPMIQGASKLAAVSTEAQIAQAQVDEAPTPTPPQQ